MGRDDPHLLLRETTLRSVLAILAITLGAVAVGETTWYAIDRFDAQGAVFGCEHAFTAEEVRECQSDERNRVEWTLLWAPAALMLSACGAGGGSIVRRARLRQLPLADLPAVATVNERAAAEIGTAVLPLFWRPSHPIATARADGIFRRYVEVGPAWLSAAVVEPERAAAILRHEYAHHRCRDVLPARLSLWGSAAFGALTIPMLVTIWDNPAGAIARAIGRLAVLAAIVVLARASVLRARERDADEWAAASGSAPLVSALGDPARSTRVAAVVRRALASHPPVERRLEALAEPASNRRLRVADAVLAAATAVVGAPLLTRLVGDWTTSGMWFTYPAVVGWGAVGGLLGGWLILAVLRAGAGDTDDRQVRGLGRFAAAVGLTSLFGGFLFSTPLLTEVRSLPTHLTDIVGAAALAGGVAVLVLWCADVVAWTSQGVNPGRRVPYPVTLIVGVVSGAFLLGNLGQLDHAARLFAGADVLSTGGLNADEPLTIVAMAQTLNSEWFATVLLVIAAVVPLTVTIATGTGARDLVRSVAVGAWGGCLAVGAFWLFREVWDPESTASPHGWQAAILVAYAYPALLGGVVAAAVGAGASTARRFGVVTAGLGGVVGTLVASLGSRLILDPDDYSFLVVLRNVSLGGLVGSLLVAAAVAGVRHRRQNPLFGIASVGGAVIVAAAALIGVGSLAASARPSPAEDRAYYVTVVNHALNDQVLAFNERYADACNGFVDRAARPDLTDLIERFDLALYRPGTPNLRATHDHLLDSLRVCQQALDAAEASDNSRLDIELVAQSQASLTTWYAEVEQVILLLEEDLGVNAG
jgi:hypothetical protein